MEQKLIFQITQDEQIEKQFSEIADKLLNHCVLKTPKKIYRLAEIEFYYFNQIIEEAEFLGVPSFEGDIETKSMRFSHQDFFTHQSSEQGKNSNWYLHRKGKSIIETDRKGIDFTIGNEKEKSFCGVLIRAIQNIDGSEYTYGTSIVLDKIINDLGKNNVKEITNILELSALDTHNSIHIEPKDLIHEEIYSCFRQGLKIGKKDTFENKEKGKFINKEYRFFISPLQRHEGKEKAMIDWREKYSDEKILSIFGRKTMPLTYSYTEKPRDENDFYPEF